MQIGFIGSSFFSQLQKSTQTSPRRKTTKDQNQLSALQRFIPQRRDHPWYLLVNRGVP